MNAEEFKKKTGRGPESDDLERVNCDQVGAPGHHACGWCEKHDKPRFECACLAGFRPSVEVTEVRLHARYVCGKCGSPRVQLNFPVWVDANDMFNKEKWDLDYEASPEKDSDKGWCLVCEDHTLVRKE